mmetsp:Transcript_31365/g.66793  ORF Transcript_31365/g.66793 Transcript_31365/m.66793 type:complete len:129 (-) Transcript_31365:98-484(-)
MRLVKNASEATDDSSSSSHSMSIRTQSQSRSNIYGFRFSKSHLGRLWPVEAPHNPYPSSELSSNVFAQRCDEVLYSTLMRSSGSAQEFRCLLNRSPPGSFIFCRFGRCIPSPHHSLRLLHVALCSLLR